MKLINQLMFNIHCAAMAEVLPMAVKMGLIRSRLESVPYRHGPVFCPGQFWPLDPRREFRAWLPPGDAYKDMVHAGEISSAHRIPLPVTAAAMVTYQMALDQGLGEENKGP